MPARRRRVWRIVGLSLLAVVLLVVAAVTTVLIDSATVLQRSEDAQRERLAAHRSEVDALPDGRFPAWTDRSAAPGLTATTPFNQVQSIGTHNSYAERPSAIQNTVLAIAAPGEPAQLDYAHVPLWDQLEQGVRTFELDVRIHLDGALRVTHVPLVANGGNTVDFRLALDELALWSSSHPGHLPVTVLIEFKGDQHRLDWTLREWDAEALAVVDDTLHDRLGASLVTPEDLGGPGEAGVVRENWPTVGDLAGSVMVIMHPGAALGPAYDERPRAAQAMFQAAYADSPDLADALFVLHDEPDAAVIGPLVAQGYIVRTRADANLHTDPAERDRAFATGAQLISTDFPAPLAQEGSGYVVGFSDGALNRVAPR